ncbi:MAG: hypothetical protein JWS10_1381 [Cypionkella sp.]|uniref:hypothetical protein n=1 Tax=Cypionkella sp. TaxID=2811411 RepID=UPI002609F531|nr:hypothetical protein [Cypionkella sp.]MDB5658766.1 hypothetical protein [Cypionkella sp.]
MSRILFALLFCSTPAFADVNMFQRLSGIYGDPHPDGADCTQAVQRLTFADQNTRGDLQVVSDPQGPNMHVSLDLPFTVLHPTQRGIEIRFDDEEILTPNGTLVVWEFRPLKAPNRYCWHRTDWPTDRCINMVQFCEAEVPMS